MSVGRFALVALLLFGCDGSGDSTTDDARPVDAEGADAAPDAAPDTALDAEAMPDALPDAALDAAPPLDGAPDGATPDALPADSGPDALLDAVPLDALPIDALPIDALPIDAVVDAAPPDSWVRPEVCDAPRIEPVRAVVEAESPANFGAGDMAFDAFGRIAVIDGDGHLYRMDTTGARALWAESVARTPRGLAYLSTGALIVADSGRGMLQIVYPAGELRTLVHHMDAPFGLDVDHDDFVYVSESSRGGITRVDPFSGEMLRLADGLPFSPAALALSPDEQTLYISARRSGVVYAMDRDAEGDFGAVRIHGILPASGGEAPGVCGDGERGAGEQCDDANNLPGDGCGDDCAFDPYNGPDPDGEVYPLAFDAAGEARLIFTTDAPGELDRFEFTLEADATVSIHTVDLHGDDCSGDTVVALYRAGEDDPIAQNDDDPLRITRLCSRLFPAEHGALDPLPAGDYVITARQYSDQQTELDGNWLVVRAGLVPPEVGDPCGTADAWQPCPADSNCGEVDGERLCIAAVCGDGHLAAGEACDDGNDRPGDGCDEDCGFDPYNGDIDAEGGTYPLAFDEGGTARVVFTTDAPGDVDRFSFTLDDVSDISIRTRDLPGEGCSGDTVLALYRAGEDEPLAENDDDPLEVLGNCARLFPIEHPALDDLPPGDYVITARQLSGDRIEQAGNWLIVQQAGDALQPGDVCEGLEAWLDCPGDTTCRDVGDARICVGHICGDGRIGGDEICDDGNLDGGDGCGPDCTLDPFNGEVDADDGIYPLVFDAAGEARVIYMTEQPGDSDRFEFTIDAPTTLEILTTDLPGDGCSGDTWIDVFRDGEDEPFATNDDDPTRARRLCSLVRPEEHPEFGPLDAGRYIIATRQFSGRATELEGNWLIVRPAGPVLEPDGPCAELAEGDGCVRDDGERGICEQGRRQLECAELPPPEEICPEVDQGCLTIDGERGICVVSPDGIYCHVGPDCGEETEGDPCQSRRTQGPGVCTARGGPLDVCQPIDPCDDRAAGEPCAVREGLGVCRDHGEGGATYCAVAAEGGDITALETDDCGHLYAADDVSGAVWRFDPAGDGAARLSTLHRGGLTALAFEPDAETLFVGGRGGADLLALPVGLPGRPMVRPIADDAVPDTPQDPQTWRCLGIPDGPVSITELGRPRGYHDVAFDDEGYIIGFDGTALVRVDRDDRLQPYALGLNRVEGLDFLPDGSLLVLAQGGLIRIAPNGAQEVLAGDVSGYGVTVGPDGRIYVGNNQDHVWRIDPVTALVEPYLDARPLERSFAPRNIAFDLDASLMYIGTFGPDIYALTLDARLDPVGAPRYFATVKPDVRFVDGLTVDACGQLYAPNYETSTLNRGTPDGEMMVYKQWQFSEYGHNAVWGSGIGGWRRDALYLPQPYDGSTVIEVVVGIDGATLEPVVLPEAP